MDAGEIKLGKDFDKNSDRLKSWFLGTVKSGSWKTAKVPKKINDQFAEDMIKSYREIGNASANMTIDQIESETPNRLKAELVPDWELTFEESVQIQSERIFESAGITNAEILGKAKAVIIQGLADGLSVEEQIRLLDDVFPDFSNARKEVIVRTNSSEATNWGRMSVMKEDKAVVGYTYWAIIDERTTDICDSLDGKHFKKTDSDFGSIVPPNHYGCRSYLEPVYAWDDSPRYNSSDKFTNLVPDEFQTTPAGF